MKSLLLVEDDDTTRTLMSYYITEEHKVTVLEASNIKSAQSSIRCHLPPVILLDFHLEGDLAYPVIETIQQEYKKKPVVVLMTALSGADTIATSIKADYVLKKPFCLDTIDKLLVDIL